MPSTPLTTNGSFTYAQWEEKTIGPGPDDRLPRLAHATVTNGFSGGIEADSTLCEYSIVYTDEGESGPVGTFTGLELLSGSVDGREGTFVVEERGHFEGTTVHCEFEVVAGSATGRLTGLGGSGSFTAERGMRAIPYTFAYTLD